MNFLDDDHPAATRFVLGVALLISFAADAGAQEPLSLVRRVPSVAAPITDTSVLRRQRVELAVADVRRVPQTSSLTLDLFADVSLRATRQRVDTVGSAQTWVGVLDGYPGSNVVLSVVGDEFVGHVYAPFGFFRIEREGDGYVVEQVTVPAPPAGDGIPVDATAPPDVVRPRSSHPDDGRTIDVMVVYTTDAIAGFGGLPSAAAAIGAAIGATNQAFRNSRVDVTLRLVYSIVLPYEESGNSGSDLVRLQTVNDGMLDLAHTRRDEYAADLVMLVTERWNSCGLGYILSVGAPASFGFAMVPRACVVNFAHEIGHNLGAAHDWYVTTGGGAFPYSKGHVSLAGRFHDVMAYRDLCTATQTPCSPALYFANPDVEYNGYRTGVPAGTNTTCRAREVAAVDCDANVAATFRRTAAGVARFRESRTGIAARTLLPGQSWMSENGSYRLTYQADGNLVLFDHRTTTPLWATNTAGRPAGQALMQTDGNFVVYDASGTAAWSSGTGGIPAAHLLVQNDANLVIYRPDGLPAWDRYR